MNINATTKIFGIFGHPVSHSLSPVMHNNAFEMLNLNCVYVAFDIQPDDLESATSAIRTLGIRGINVTIPHKEKIISFIDEISPEATLTGAINTIINDDGKLTGYNTDVGGFLRAINDDLEINPKGSRVFLLGAGGAARAVLTALCMKEAKEIYIINRTFEKAKSLASEFKKHFAQMSIFPYSLDERQAVENSLKSSDLLVNATSSGMEGIRSIDLKLELLPKKSKIYDLVYKPRKTVLIKNAKQLGLRAAGGLSMLLYQGAESFEIWTGEDAPIEVMRKAIE
ncbi:MAG: shikimate dehydrogenase [Thermodesulfobacteriota bacterium]